LHIATGTSNTSAGSVFVQTGSSGVETTQGASLTLSAGDMVDTSGLPANGGSVFITQGSSQRGSFGLITIVTSDTLNEQDSGSLLLKTGESQNSAGGVFLGGGDGVKKSDVTLASGTSRGEIGGHLKLVSGDVESTGMAGNVFVEGGSASSGDGHGSSLLFTSGKGVYGASGSISDLQSGDFSVSTGEASTGIIITSNRSK